jgi:hypothetical protein
VSRLDEKAAVLFAEVQGIGERVRAGVRSRSSALIRVCLLFGSVQYSGVEALDDAGELVLRTLGFR